MPGYVIRHGETAGNEKGVARGVTDIPLNSEGISQAHKDAAVLLSANLTSLRASRLERAWHFAKIVGKTLGLTPVSTKRLDTLDIGALTKKDDNEIQEQIAHLMTVEPGKNFPNGQSTNDWLNQIWPEISYFFTLVKYGKNPGIITHGRVCNVILALVRGNCERLDRATLEQKPQQHTGEIYRLSWDETKFVFDSFYNPSPKRGKGRTRS
jgi:uncharacterized phosphatase